MAIFNLGNNFMSKKKITYEELIKKGGRFENYSEEAEYISSLSQTGSISPILSGGTNGKKPALPLKYWIYEEEPDYSAYLEEIKYKLSNLIKIDFYMKHPDIYLRERKYVLMLNEYLIKNRKRLDVKISENERSFDIWRLEKFLSGRAINGSEGKIGAGELLRHCGMGMDMLNVYRTAEPMAYYVKERLTPQNILISENLDPFYGMRKYLMEGERLIFGTEFNTLIYGGGKKVSSIFADFDDFAEEYMKNPSNTFYYIGDLDYEGIGIFEGLYRKLHSSFRLEPFMEGYMALLTNIEFSLLPHAKEGQNRNVGEIFFSFFDADTTEQIKSILKEGHYIPQEKLSIMDYRVD